MYDVIKNKPVATFRYKGTHSKPVRRVVLITNKTRDTITGYQLREGNDTWDIEDASIKSFSIDKIATTSEGESTLQRTSLKNLVI